MATCYTIPWISRTGNRLACYFADKNAVDATENPLAVTAINYTPFAIRNGQSIVLPAPSWASTSAGNPQTGLKIALVEYWLPDATPSTTALDADTWLFNAPAGWVTAGGLPAQASVNQMVIWDGLGALERPFILPPRTIPLGSPTQWPNAGKNWVEYHPQANMGKIWIVGGTNVTSIASDGYPLTVSGPVSVNLWNTVSSNSVDKKQMPTNNGAGNQMGIGTWTIYGFENNLSNPMTITASASTGWTVSAVTRTVGSWTVAGSNYNTQWIFTVQRNAPTSWNLNLYVTVTPGTASTAWSIARNWLFLRPGSDTGANLTSNSDISPSRNVLNLLTATNGKTPYCIRHGDDIMDYDAFSNAVDVGDMVADDAWTWAIHSRAIQITAIRPPTFPLTVYLWDSYGGIGAPAPGGSPGPYQVSVATNAPFQWSQQSGFYEVVCGSAHGLKTGSYPTMPQYSEYPLGNIQFQNSLSSTITTGNLNNNSNVIWVTGPDTFVSLVYISSRNTQFAMPTTSQTAGGHTTLNLPDKGSQPIAAACQFDTALGSHSWFSLPLYGSPALYTDLANRILANTTPGNLVYVTSGNEVWANTTQGKMSSQIMSNIGGESNYYDWYATQLLSVYTSFQNVFGAAGRGSEIKLIASSQGVAFSPQYNETVTLCKALSVNNVPVSYIGVAHYPSPDGSPSNTLANTWPVADIVDYARDQIWCNIDYRGNASFWANQKAAIAANFNVTYSGSQWPLPGLIMYELAMDSVVRGTSNNQTTYNLVHDCVAHPNYYDLINTLFATCQVGGFAFANMSSLCMPIYSGTAPWALVQWEGQQPGYGDGRNGTTVNQFASAQGGMPADSQSHIGPDSVNPNGNVSPHLQAFLDWIAVTGNTPPSSLTPVSGSGAIKLGSTAVANSSSPGSVAVPMPATSPAPLFSGQPIFGDKTQFMAVQFLVDVPKQIDMWLGLAAGTTQYGAPSGGRCWGIQGTLIDVSPDMVSADQAMLLAFIGQNATLGLPTGFAWPGDYYQYHNCRYVASEIKLGTIMHSPGNQWQSSYRLIIRQTSNQV
jgi:hypothetical protein